MTPAEPTRIKNALFPLLPLRRRYRLSHSSHFRAGRLHQVREADLLQPGPRRARRHLPLVLLQVRCPLLLQ